ncbi:hypothetical protein AAF712_013935 [Marasmius tenuissimus]|uniref:Uncharacterized protein n=1 Tax=Marasmius tenuissimus TaxID=585030 RepID=A0ABR2ZDP5_9AGAR
MPDPTPGDNFARRRQALETLATARANRQEGQQNATPSTVASGVPSEAEPGPKKTPRPEGRPGQDFNLCAAMGLSKSSSGFDTYNALKRATHRALFESRIPWDKKSWTSIDSADKATLFAIMRERDPILAKFESDWASEWLVRGYIKSLRSQAYKRNTLARPAKYDYLVANSARRDPTKSRKSKARQDYEDRKARKEREKEKRRAERRAEKRRDRQASQNGEGLDEETGAAEGSSGGGPIEPDEAIKNMDGGNDSDGSGQE